MKRKIILISILISGMLFFFSFEENHTIEKENEEKINEFFTQSEQTTTTTTNVSNTYLGVLEVPTINLKQGFYNYNSKENNVDKNIELISKNCNPKDNCLFILASHSGTSSISFFKNLDKLNRNDTAILYYEQEKYTYQLTEIIYQEKNGTISLRNQGMSELILTTCNKEDDNIQNIYRFVRQ